jgi:hypothetical protein
MAAPVSGATAPQPVQAAKFLAEGISAAVYPSTEVPAVSVVVERGNTKLSIQQGGFMEHYSGSFHKRSRLLQAPALSESSPAA